MITIVKGLFSRIPDTTIHITLALVWICLAIPTVLFWSESILWILMISIYANVGAHISAWEGAKNDDKIDEILERLKRLESLGE